VRRLLRLAARLYPPWWRQRYASEFEALLEDVNPGWRQLFDVMTGALTMQLRTLGTIPVVCTLAGALVGGVVAMQMPEIYASSATIRMNARDITNAESATAKELQASLEKALGGSSKARAATSVTLVSGDSAQTTVRLTYTDRDPVQAQRVAETLTAAVATESGERATSTEILDSPALPAAPIAPDYPMTIASGGAAGLVAGGVVVLLVRSRRRPASAG